MTSNSYLDTLSPLILDLPDDLRSSFDEPWQAELFAITVELSKAGVFTWKDWVEVFSEMIKSHPQLSLETVNQAYYRQWLDALEALLSDLKVVTRVEIDETQEHWRRSYMWTEHGKAVILRRGHAIVPTGGLHHHHHHHDRGHTDGIDSDHPSERIVPVPIAISDRTHRLFTEHLEVL